MGVKKKHIPIHRMEEFSSRLFHIEKADKTSTADKDAILLGAHRDDHYIFIFQESGSSGIMVDFTTYRSQKNMLFFVLPGQVHSYLGASKNASGWFIAVDTTLVPGLFRGLFEDPLLIQKPLQVEEAGRTSLLQCLQLLYTVFRQGPDLAYSRQVAHALLSSFCGLVAGVYKDQLGEGDEKPSRAITIAGQFRKLLAGNYKSMKSPAEYASSLNLSLSYLNEVVKNGTGFSVSHWIQHEIILEARRLLYHSEYSVKEIAHELGYEDHTYFSRLFKKVVHKTPGEFRRRYRE